MARVQVDRTSPNVRLQPQATPVNTYSQPEAATPSSAEMRAKILEGALSNVSTALQKKADREYREQMALFKEEIAVTASADFITFKNSIAKDLETLSPEDTVKFIDDEFNKRYGNAPNPYVATALMGLKGEFISNAAGVAFKRVDKERTQQFMDSVGINIADIAKTAEQEGWDDKKVTQAFDSLFTTSKKSGRITPVDFNSLIIKSAADNDPSGRIWKYIQEKKLDQTQRPEYEAGLNAIRKKMTSDLGEDLKFSIVAQANTLIETGSDKQLAQKIPEWRAALKKVGKDPLFLLEKLEQAKAKRNSLEDIRLKTVATDAAVKATISNGGMVSGEHSYVDTKGQTHYVSEADIKRGVQAHLKQNPANKGVILNNVTDPVTTNALMQGLANMQEVGSDEQVTFEGQTITKHKRAGVLFARGLDAFNEAMRSGGIGAARKQAGSNFEVYETARKLVESGAQIPDIVRSLSRKQAGEKSIPASKDQRATMVNAVVESNGGGLFGSGWFNDEAQNTGYIGDKVAQLYEMYSYGAIDQEAAMEAAVSTFNSSHTFLTQNGVHVMLNHNNLVNIRELAGLKPGSKMDNVSAPEMLQKLSDAAQYIKATQKEAFPLNTEEEVFLMPNVFNPKQFMFQTASGRYLPNTQIYTAAELYRFSVEWRKMQLADKQKRTDSIESQNVSP